MMRFPFTRRRPHEIKCWQAEIQAANLYIALSDAEVGTPRQFVFLELASETREQAVLWAIEARKSGLFVPEYMADRRTRILLWMIKTLGSRSVKPLLTWIGLRGMGMFTTQNKPASRQRSHFIYALNEGMFALAVLIGAAAGAKASAPAILVIGVAGLLAGALTTAAGEYIALRAPLSLSPPNSAHEELVRIYQGRGMDVQQANLLATRVMADPDGEVEQEFIVEETPMPEVGVQEPPIVVATRAFFAFVVGGLVPLAPYVLGFQRHPLLIALVFAAIGVMLSGAKMSAISGRQPLWGSFRILGIGIVLGVAAFMVGGWVSA